MADALHAARFPDQEITTMIVSNSRLLAGPDPRREDLPPEVRLSQHQPGQQPPGQDQPGQGQPGAGQPGRAS
jgi:hypothetical protein